MEKDKFKEAELIEREERLSELTDEELKEMNNSSETTGNPNSDYKLIADMLKDMEEQVKYLQGTAERRLADDYGLDNDIIEAILPIRKEEIENRTVPVEELRELLHSHNNVASKTDKVFCVNVVEWLPVSPSNLYTDDEIYEIAAIVKDTSTVVLSSHKDFHDIKEDSLKVLDEYVNYLSSTKITEIRKNRLNDLKDQIEFESDSYKKKKMQDKIVGMEKALDYSFIPERLKNVKEKEINAILDGFFNSRKGDYVLKKYTGKIKMFGYNTNVYKYFFNIEETFLPEEYKPFNNLFLYVYMRFVGYADPYKDNDKLWVQSFTGALANLIYHRFSKEQEEQFIDTIKEVIQFFWDKREYFVENNTTWEGHPMRIEHKEKVLAEKKDTLINKLKELKYPDEIDEEMTASEIQKIYDEYVDKLIIDQMPEKEADETEEDKEAIKELSDAVDEAVGDENETDVLKEKIEGKLSSLTNSIKDFSPNNNVKETC